MNLLNPKGDINLHTHTRYCDGKDDPEDMVLAAIDMGFRVLGFSSHAYAAYDTDVCMTQSDTLKYRQQILELREKYKDQISIRLGIELDQYAEPDGYPYDYIIGSTHYLFKDGEYLPVDDTEEKMIKAVSDHFDGDFRKYIEYYYHEEANVLAKTGADIVGHFDLVTKFNEGNKFFDEHATWYKKAALRALAQVTRPYSVSSDNVGNTNTDRHLVQPIVEINTGAMAKGYRTRPYPDQFLLDEIERLNCPVILSSDCHDRTKLNYGFDLFIGK